MSKPVKETCTVEVASAKIMTVPDPSFGITCSYLATDNFDRTAEVNLVATSNATSDMSGGVPPSRAEYIPINGLVPDVTNCDIAGGVARMLASQPPMNDAVWRWSNKLEVTVPSAKKISLWSGTVWVILSWMIPNMWFLPQGAISVIFLCPFKFHFL